MKYGNWIPVDKNLSYRFPKERPFSDIEAILSLTLDYDRDMPVSVAGYALRWKWSRTKVRNFLKKTGVEIKRSMISEKRGHLVIQKKNISESRGDQVRIVDNKEMSLLKNIPQVGQGHIKDRSLDTTIIPNKNINKKNSHLRERYNIEIHPDPF